MATLAPERTNASRRKMIFGLVINGGSRALLVATPAITLPIVTDSLGPANYGAYAVITTIAVFLSFADLGVSLGMITTASQADGRGDLVTIRRVVSTGIAMLTTVCGVLVGAALLLWALVDWRALLGLTDPAVTADISLAVLVIMLCLAVSIPAFIGIRVMLGLQMNRAFAFWQVVSVPIVVAAVAIGHANDAGLAWFVLSTAGTPTVVALFAMAWLFKVARPDLAPRLSSVDRAWVKPMLALGSAFAVSSAAWAASQSTISVVISHTVGAEAAGVYNISEKLSSLSFYVFESLLLPLWPMFAARLAVGDYAATRSGLRVAVVASVVIGTVTSAGYMWLAPELIRLWLGEEFVPPFDLLLALAVFSVLHFAAQPFTLVLNGAGAKRFILVSTATMALVAVPLSLLLASLVGISGPTWALSISLAACVLIPSAWAAGRRTRHPQQEALPSQG